MSETCYDRITSSQRKQSHQHVCVISHAAKLSVQQLKTALNTDTRPAAFYRNRRKSRISEFTETVNSAFTVIVT